MKLKSMLGFVLILVFILSLCLPSSIVSAQSSPPIDWLDQFGTDVRDHAYAVGVDGAGNAYVTGYTAGSIPDQSSIGGYDAFVRKYDRSGQILWTRQFGSSFRDIAHDIAVDMAGNVYVVGRTNDALPGKTHIGDFDAFIRKYDMWGNEVWTDQFGTISRDYAYGVAVDTRNNVCVAGYTLGDLTGEGSLGNMDAFVRKYDGWGNVLWTKQYGTIYDDSSGGVVMDRMGNVYLGGWTKGDLAGQSQGGMDAFIRKYDMWGNEVWTDQFGTDQDDYPGGIALDGAGNIYMNGSTNGDLQGYTNLGGQDAFVRKYDRWGNVLWTHQFGTDQDDYPGGIAVDGRGNAYITGSTEGDFPGYINLGYRDVYVCKYDKWGNELWLTQFGTEYFDQNGKVAVDMAGNTYVVGSTQGSLYNQTHIGDADAFIIKFEHR